MRSFNSSWGCIIMCLAELVIGILLFIRPVGFTSAIIVVLGILVLANGVTEIIKYFKSDAREAAQKGGLSKGLIFALLGGFCVFKSNWFIITFPVLTVIYGLLNLLLGMRKIQWTVDMLRLKHRYWFTALISAILSCVFAVLILADPFASTEVLWKFIAVSLIIEALADCVIFFTERKGSAAAN